MSEDAQQTDSSLATKQIIEGLLLAAGKPLPMNKIAEVFSDKERPEPDELKAALAEIEADCEARGFELKKVASGYRFQVKQQYSDWVGKLWDEKPQRYSRALLETISIIAYRQPVTRGEIEKIRGVAVSTNIIRTLIEREWVRIVGHRDVPGRPAMFATTKLFLDYFNLKSLDELPPLSEIRDMDELEPELSLEEESHESRVLEFPSAEEMGDDFDVLDEEEERAAAIGTRPIEEILGIEEEEPEEEDWDDEEDLDASAEPSADLHEAPASEINEEASEDATQEPVVTLADADDQDSDANATEVEAANEREANDNDASMDEPGDEEPRP